MTNVLKKGVVSVLSVAMITVFAFSSVASQASAEMTMAEMQALIAQLTAQLAAMQAGGSTTTTTTSAGEYVYRPNKTVDYEFTKFLKKGMRGNEVKMLQQALNSLDTGYFGNITLGAVKSFQASVGLVADGYVGPLTRAKLNEKAAGTGTGTGTGSAVTGDKLVVSGVASDDMIVGPSQTVVVAKLTFQAGDEDVKVKNINVKYTGSADESKVVDKVVLLDAAMLELDTDGLNSSDEAKVRADKVVKDGESMTMYVALKTKAFISADNQNGLDGSLEVKSVTTDGADVEGLPISGAVHEFHSGVSVDKYDAEISQEKTGTVKIGEEGVKIATINIENKSTSDDKETVKSIKLERTGTAGDDAIDNVEIKVDGKTYKASQDKEDYVFDFGDGVELAENGDDFDFVVYADIEDDSTKTFAFKVTDAVVVDEDNVFLSDSTVGAGHWDYAGTVTIDLSEIDISKTTDVQSGKVAAAQDGAELASFKTRVEGKDVEGDLEVTVVVSNVDIENGDGVANAPVVVDVQDVDLENMAIYTKDGDKISEKEDTSFSITPTDGTDDQATYKVTFDDVKFDAGSDYVDYVIKGDINKDAPDGTRYEIKQIKYVSIEDKDGEDIADVTESIASPAQMEVEAAVVEVSVEDATDTDLNSDADAVEVAQVKIDASNSGDDINVTRVKLAFATTAAGDRDGDLDTDADDNAFILDKLTNCELFDAYGSVSNKEDAAATTTFDVDIDVTKDTEKTLFVKCDIGSEFGNNDTIDVTGISYKADGVHTDANLDVTGAPFSGTTTTATVTTGSTVLSITSSDVNDNKVVRDNANDVVLGEYEFKAKDAELNIATITALFTDDTAAEDVSNEINGKVDLYINGHKEASETPSTTAAFTGLGYTVAKDQTVTITFKADIKAVGDGPFGIDAVAMTTEEGVSVSNLDTNGANNYDGPEVTVVAALPVITKRNTDTSNLETADDVVVFSYSVKAEGGDVQLGHTEFEVTDNTNVDLKNLRVEVYDNAAMTGSDQLAAAVTHADVAAGNPFVWDANLDSVTVSENDTYYVFLIADTTATDATRVLRAQVSDAAYSAGATGMYFESGATANFQAAQDLDASLLIEGDMKSLLKKD